MNQSNDHTQLNEASATTHQKESHFEITPGQTCKTPEGNEYIVDCIARESGNTEDLFAVFKKMDGEINWVKKTSDFTGPQDFDGDFDESEIKKEEGPESVSVGQKYQHFKTKDFYIIKAVAYNRNNPKEKFIIYEGQYNSPEFGDNPIWIREYSDFTGMKFFGEDERDSDGNKKLPVKRFTLIEN